MELHTDLDQFPNQISKPTGNDKRSALSVRVPFEGVANRTRWLRNRAALPQTVTGAGGNPGGWIFDVIVLPDNTTPTISIQGSTGFISCTSLYLNNGLVSLISSRSYERVAEAIFVQGEFTIATDEATFPPVPVWEQGAAGLLSVSSSMQWLLRPPHGATMTGAKIRVEPGTHSGLPTTMPRLRVYACDVAVTNGTPATLILDQIDPAASVAAYEPAHTITASGGTHVVDRARYMYIAVFTGEYGTNAVADQLLVNPSRYIFTRALIGEE